MKIILLVLLLLAAPAIAADVAPSPAQTAQAAALRAILAIEHARAEVRLAVDAQEAAQGPRASAVAPAPMPVTAAPTVTTPPPDVTPAPVSPVVTTPTVDAAPVVVQGPIETKLSIPAQIQTDLISLASVLITGMVGIGLAWMRSHLAFMKNIGMNQEVTTSAEGFGALLVQQLKQQGIPATLDIRNPQVAALTQKVFDNYQGYTAALGITPDKVATLILKGAAKVLPPTDPAPTKPVIITQAAPVPNAVMNPNPAMGAIVPQDPYGGARDGRSAPHATAPTWPS
jgi:hypothetical protein